MSNLNVLFGIFGSKRLKRMLYRVMGIAHISFLPYLVTPLFSHKMRDKKEILKFSKKNLPGDVAFPAPELIFLSVNQKAFCRWESGW